MSIRKQIGILLLLAASLGDAGAALSTSLLHRAATAAPGTAESPPGADISHQVFDRLLERYVDQNGWVDYDGLSRERSELNAYLEQLASARPASFSTDHERLAFWIDAYNASTLADVLDHVYRKTAGVKQTPGFFDERRHFVGGEHLTLDQIEERARDFHDPRVHFALVCASTSCPKLQRFAYKGGVLETQMQRVTQEFLSDTARGVQIDARNNRIFLSPLFKWYAGDFTGQRGAGQFLARAVAFASGSNVLGYIKQHAEHDVASYMEEKRPTVEYFEYDWSLNSRQNHRGNDATKRHQR